MNKKTRIALAFTIMALGGAYLVYNRYFNKKRFVKMILSKVPTTSESVLEKMDLGYLRGRAFALKNNDVSFQFKGKTYSSKDGKVIR